MATDDRTHQKPAAGARSSGADLTTPLPGKTGFPRARHLQIGVRALIVLVACCGTVAWAVRVVWENNHPELAAVRSLRAPSATERVQGSRELGRFGIENSHAAISPLIIALGDTEADVRAAAADALLYVVCDTVKAGSGDGEVRAAIKALVGSLKDPQPPVRFAAANALAYIIAPRGSAGVNDDQTVRAAFTATLGDANEMVRLAALKGLATVTGVGPTDPPNELIAALNDESAANRAAAVGTLASFHCSLDRWIPTLFRMLTHDEPSVRKACAAALDRLTPPAATLASLPELVKALGSDDQEVRLHAATALERLGPDRRAVRAVPALLAILKATFAADRVAAGKSGTRVTDEPVWDPTPNLAIGLLSQVAPETEAADEVILVLTEGLRAGHIFLPELAAVALGEFGHAAQPAVPELIKFARERIKGHGTAGGRAARALGRIAPDSPSAGEAVSVLIEALKSEAPGTRLAAIEVLPEFGPKMAARAIPQLRALQNELDISTRAATAKGLQGSMRGARSEPTDASIRAAIAKAFITLHGEQ